MIADKFTDGLASQGLYWMGSRYYDPALGRFISPDSVVPDKGNPQGFDRYAYVANNPISRIDTSGHCWGIASGIRGLPSYGTTCNNLDMALTIVQSDQASAGEKLAAGAYVAAEGTAHLALVTGGAMLACSAVAPCVKAAESALGIGSAACADGDCTNEVNGTSQAAQMAARTAESVVDKLQRYLLNPTHKDGGPKAKWFEQALGFTRDNLDDLAKQIVFDPNKATPTELTQWGQKYQQIITITGANGKVIDVPFIWMRYADDTIRLITVPWIPSK